MSDLSKFSLSQTSYIRVKTPDGKVSDLEIELYNKFTKQYERARAATLRIGVEKLVENKREQMDTDEVRDQIALMLAKCTASWKNLEWDGEQVPFSEEKAYEIYSDPGFEWLLDQVDNFVHSSRNFLGN